MTQRSWAELETHMGIGKIGPCSDESFPQV